MTYGVTKEAARFGLPCGGNLRLVQDRCKAGVDRQVQWPAPRPRAGGAHARPGDRRRDRGGVARRSSSSTASGCARCSAPLRMLIIGAGQLSRVLAQMALTLDFEVTCCDPREGYHLTWDVPAPPSQQRPCPTTQLLELPTRTAPSWP